MNEECGLYSILTRRKKKLLEFERKRGEIKGLSCQEVGPKYSPGGDISHSPIRTFLVSEL